MKPSLKVSDEDSKGDIVHAIRVLVVEGIQHTDEARCKWIHSLLVKWLVHVKITWKLHKENFTTKVQLFFLFFHDLLPNISGQLAYPLPKKCFRS